MLNIEKYKDDILNAAQADITCCVIDLYHNGKCPDNCKDCKKAAMEWLLEEYKEPILNDTERKYLSAVIRPFKKDVCTVCKKYVQSCSGLSYEYLVVKLSSERWGFPKFVEGTMYKGMELDKEYTLEELGL